MEPLATIRAKLAKYPKVQAEYDGDAVTVRSETADGFDVTFYSCEPEFVVSLGGWHDHFDNASDALAIFFIALTIHARMRVTKRGATECKWTLEMLRGDAWLPHSTCSSFISPFWLHRSTVIQQNDILPVTNECVQ